MKFKYLVIVFSILIVIIISITALFPLLVGGPDFAATFRFFSLPLLIFMILLLGIIGIVLLFNYRLLSLLEREDWPALAYYLEQKIYIKGRYYSRYVRLLASSYFVITDFQSVLKLESKAQLNNPSVIKKNVLLFGAARILSKNHMEAAAFFNSYLQKDKNNQWVRWFYGFSQLLTGAFSVVEPEFSSLAVSSNSALITGLSAYFLNDPIAKYSSDPEKCRKIADTGKERVIKSHKNFAGWNKEVERMSTNIHVAIIRKYINETGAWLFGSKGKF